VPPTSRFNIDANAVDGLQSGSFGALIQVTNDVPIIVERSMYWDVNGLSFAAGTNATGIRLPDLPVVVDPPAEIRIVGSSGSTAFTPNPAPIATGRTIAWRNDDGLTHRIVADDGSFDTGNINFGATSVAVTRPAGTVPYHCSIHPSMVGTITVP
jgi:plastocyanin